jgi:hypothetical protein
MFWKTCEILRALKDSAPPKLSATYCPETFLPSRLEDTNAKEGISLASPHKPKPMLQPLPSMLRIEFVSPI